jgi:hypothetical protein
MNPLRLLVLVTLFLSVVCNADIRTWTAVNGKEVEAEFVSNEKGIVKLKLKSGKVFEVPANKLSKEDNEFISSLDNLLAGTSKTLPDFNLSLTIPFSLETNSASTSLPLTAVHVLSSALQVATKHNARKGINVFIPKP